MKKYWKNQGVIEAMFARILLLLQKQESSTENVQLQTRLLLNGFKALCFVRDLFGSDDALEICKRMEYHWNQNSDFDTF